MFGIWTLIVIVAAYLLGAVPFGIIIAKAAQKDLTKSGSGNQGAANAFRTLGAKGGAGGGPLRTLGAEGGAGAVLFAPSAPRGAPVAVL